MILNKTLQVQIISFLVAGLSQVFALSICSNQLSQSESSRYMYLLSMATLLSFLDFGIFWGLYIHLASSVDEPPKLIKKAFQKILQLGLLIECFVLVGLFISILPLDIVLTISLILINNFFFVGLVALRGTRSENLYFIFFNLSWPMTFLIYSIMNLNSIAFHSIYAIVPLLSSIGINTILCSYIFLAHLTNNDPGQYSKKKNYAIDDIPPSNLSIYAMGAQILTLCSLYGDRFLLFPKMQSQEFLNYAVCIQFANVASVLIKNYNSSLVGDQLSGKKILKRDFLNAIPVIPFFGLISGFIYFFSMPFIANVFFNKLAIDYFFLFLLSLNIFLIAILEEIYQNLWVNMKIGTRIMLQLIGIVNYICFVEFFLNHPVSKSEAAMALILINSGMFPYIFWVKMKQSRLKNRFDTSN